MKLSLGKDGVMILLGIILKWRVHSGKGLRRTLGQKQEKGADLTAQRLPNSLCNVTGWHDDGPIKPQHNEENEQKRNAAVIVTESSSTTGFVSAFRSLLLIKSLLAAKWITMWASTDAEKRSTNIHRETCYLLNTILSLCVLTWMFDGFGTFWLIFFLFCFFCK